MAQSAPRSPSKGEIMGSIPIGAILLFLLVATCSICSTHSFSLTKPFSLWFSGLMLLAPLELYFAPIRFFLRICIVKIV